MNKNQLYKLVSLLKVLDANYVNEQDFDVLEKLDGNNADDVYKAAQIFIIPELLSLSLSEQELCLDALSVSLADKSENYSKLFKHIQLTFGMPIIDNRAFMSTLYEILIRLTNK